MRQRLIWNSMVAAAGLALAGSTSAGIVYGSAVENATQGFRKDGKAISADRSNPLNALGAPQNNNTVNFFALGFGGSITISFGVDFTEKVWITETTYGNPSSHPEAAEIFVGVGSSWDSATYFSLGMLSNAQDGAPISLTGADALSGVSVYRFLRIEDRTSPLVHASSADGFDVDGVGAIAVPGPAAASLLALATLVRGRRKARSGDSLPL